jgi:hypothetical protein
MNNSISNSTHSRTSLTQLSQNWSASRFPSALRADANQGNPSVEASASVVEKRMSVVNLEAGISAQNSFAQDQVNEMSLLYRFGQASRSRITANLMGEVNGLARVAFRR